MSTVSGDNLTLCVPRTHNSSASTLGPVIVRTKPPATLPPNHVLISVDRFGFSANNVTYQALGEEPHFRFFDYHPAPTVGEVSPHTHGLVPVWGFGTIALSTHPRVKVGERVYGYFAPTRYLCVPVSASDVNKYAFYVPRPHLPADRRPYNQILRCATDAHYDPSPVAEDLTMLYRPLFWTSYWCEDWLSSSSYRGGATRVLISSASSKTAFCLAYRVRKRGVAGMRVVRRTSVGNVAFTEGLGLYDAVVEYGAVGSSPALRCLAEGGEKWVYVDVAGSDKLNERVFAYFGSSGRQLVASVALGMTNLSPWNPGPGLSTDWTANTLTSAQGVAGRLDAFYMVEWLNIRRQQLSPAEIFAVQSRAWRELMEDCRAWVKVERVFGEREVEKAYERIVGGGLGPHKGYIWSLWEDQNSLSKL